MISRAGRVGGSAGSGLRPFGLAPEAGVSAYWSLAVLRASAVGASVLQLCSPDEAKRNPGAAAPIVRREAVPAFRFAPCGLRRTRDGTPHTKTSPGGPPSMICP